MAKRKKNHKRTMQEKLPEHPSSNSNSFQVLEEVSKDPEKIIDETNLNQEDSIQLQASKSMDNSPSQPSEQSPGKSLEIPIEHHDKAQLDMPMPDQNLDNPEEEDMKDAIPEGLDLIGLEDSCTRKAFKSIPPMQIQLLHKYLVKDKVQLGVATSSQKEKQKAHKDPKKKGRKSALQRINRLGTALVDSGQYAQLTEFFTTPPTVDQ